MSSHLCFALLHILFYYLFYFFTRLAAFYFICITHFKKNSMFF